MDNREMFMQLLRYFGLTPKKAAELICIQTMRPCSVRAIKSWVSNPGKPGSKPCPEWAVKALQISVFRDLENKDASLLQAIQRNCQTRFILAAPHYNSLSKHKDEHKQ